MPRTNRILIRSGTTVPSAADFSTNEPAFDRSSGKLYVKNAAGTMVEIGAGGATSVVEGATTAAFPATGAAATLYLATDSRRLYSWTGSVYAEVGAGGSSYTLPAATTSTLGGVIVGTGLSVTAGGTVSQRLGGYASSLIFG